MSRRSAKAKEKEIERFLMKVAETAENTLREYLQERETENRLYATEYVTRRGLIPISTNFTKSKEAAVGYVFVFQ